MRKQIPVTIYSEVKDMDILYSMVHESGLHRSWTMSDLFVEDGRLFSIAVFE